MGSARGLCDFLSSARTRAPRRARASPTPRPRRVAAELVADIAVAAGEKVAKQKVPLAEGKFYLTKPVSAGAFKALHARFARAVPAGAQVEKLVTPITVHRRGRRPQDTFAVVDDQIINDAFGAVVFKIHSATNGAAVKLVGPLEFFLTAKRDEAGELLPVKEMTVKALFCTLVPDHANPGGRPLPLDKRTRHERNRI
jgi:hypothetical protein